MTFLSIPLGAHDVPFAGPLVAGAFLAFTIAFVILKLLDRVIVQEDSGPQASSVSSRPDRQPS